MHKKPLVACLMSLAIMVSMSGCVQQTKDTGFLIHSDKEAYHIGDSIQVCMDIDDEILDNESRLFFLLMQTDSNKSASQTMWLSRGLMIAGRCYDLSLVRWIKPASSLYTDFDIELYDTVESGRYILSADICLFENGNCTFIESNTINMTIS